MVAGFGVSGFAAADNLTHLGASVTALADDANPAQLEKAQLLEILGATVHLHAGATSTLPDDVDLLVVSPGFRPDSAILVQARERGVPVWGEVELAWRLRDPDHDTPWLCVTGTNGKTTTVQMLDGILRAAGLRSQAAGNVGLPIVEAVMDPTPYDVLAVELSSFQLHYTDSLRAESAAVLNVAEDHLDWYDGPSGMDDYAADKGRIYQRVSRACVYNVADPVTEHLVREADVVEGARAIGFTLGTPDGRDGRGRRRHPRRPRLHRAAGHQRRRAVHVRRPRAARRRRRRRPTSSPTPWPPPRWPAPTASARPRSATGCGRSGRTRTGSRWWPSATASPGSTTPRPPTRTRPQSSLLAYDPVVWVAGGLAKGAAFDDLVRAVRGRLRGAVLLGRDRAVIAARAFATRSRCAGDRGRRRQD